jgi:DNA (cytosine-5)-methyltransferase 1
MDFLRQFKYFVLIAIWLKVYTENVLMRELSLFSGAGGGLLASKLLGWRTIGYVENNEYCQKVLRQRIADCILDPAPIFGDIRKFISDGYAESYSGMVDVVTGGFPCQPFSCAGKSLGKDDPRNMWPETIGVIRKVGPCFALLENVPGILAHPYFGTILGDLHESGFNVRWEIISASSLGAQHLRERLWVFAYTNTHKIRCVDNELSPSARTSQGRINAFYRTKGHSTNATDSKQNGRYANTIHSFTNYEGKRITRKTRGSIGIVSREDVGGRWWAFPDADSDRSFDDVAYWVDRLEAVGNGQVPIVAKTAWELLSGMSQKT